MEKHVKPNYSAINATRKAMLDNREAQRTSEVARVATDLQRQGMTRTEALKTAERMIPA